MLNFNDSQHVTSFSYIYSYLPITNKNSVHLKIVILLKSVINILFPKCCFSCLSVLSDNESVLCTSCRHGLPITNFHLNNDHSVTKVFYGRVKIEQATALLRFEKKGITQHLIHSLKYKGYEEIGTFLGDWLGKELSKVASYQDIDAVIPVPLHKRKLRKRGFNQVEKFGQSIAQALSTDYLDDVLLKVSNTSSQTTKGRLTRWLSSQENFHTNNSNNLNGKHILLVDDIITTGATLESCINTLQQHTSVKISIATMAIA